MRAKVKTSLGKRLSSGQVGTLPRSMGPSPAGAKRRPPPPRNCAETAPTTSARVTATTRLMRRRVMSLAGGELLLFQEEFPAAAEVGLEELAAAGQLPLRGDGAAAVSRGAQRRVLAEPADQVVDDRV